jgi:hypothetical protein
MTTVTECSHLEFTEMCRALQHQCAALGLEPVAFRTAHGPRRLRRYGSAVVVRVELGRPIEEVATDLIDGAIAACRLEGERAEVAREVLVEALERVGRTQ